MSNALSLFGRRAVIMGQPQGGGSILPAGYTAYDWVECKNSEYPVGSCLDTGYEVSQANTQQTLVFEGKFARAGDAPSNYNLVAVFTAYDSVNYYSNYGIIRYKNGSNLCFNYNARTNTETFAGQVTKTITKGKWFDFNLHPTEGQVHGGGLTFGGEEYTYTSSTNTTTQTSSIKLFYGYPCRLGRFKISKDGAVVADLVPAVRDSDNVVGFYDIVRETFYTPTGEATFTVGNGFEDFTV